MAAVSLFWDTNMAAVTSCENTLYLETVRTRKFIKDLTGVRGGFLFFLPSHCSPQILTLILMLVVINRSWVDRHKDTSFLQNMLWHPFAHPPFCLRPLIRFGAVLWNTLGTKHIREGRVRPRISDSRWWRHILSLWVFRSLYHVAKIEQAKEK